MLSPEPLPLTGYGVTLTPLGPDHGEALFAALDGDPDVWRWLWTAMPSNVEAMRDVLAAALAENSAGRWVSWAVIDSETDTAAGATPARPVGMTSYLDISVKDERLEIGGTWYARSAWATHVNPAAKLLLLSHAFDVLGAERVSLKTDHRNARSQAAIARLGGHREGVLRHHIKRPDGSWRDTVYFSILRAEWPGVRSGLQFRLGV